MLSLAKPIISPGKQVDSRCARTPRLRVGLVIVLKVLVGAHIRHLVLVGFHVLCVARPPVRRLGFRPGRHGWGAKSPPTARSGKIECCCGASAGCRKRPLQRTAAHAVISAARPAMAVCALLLEFELRGSVSYAGPCQRHVVEVHAFPNLRPRPVRAGKAEHGTRAWQDTMLPVRSALAGHSTGAIQGFPEPWLRPNSSLKHAHAICTAQEPFHICFVAHDGSGRPNKESGYGGVLVRKSSANSARSQATRIQNRSLPSLKHQPSVSARGRRCSCLTGCRLTRTVRESMPSFHGCSTAKRVWPQRRPRYVCSPQRDQPAMQL